MEEMKNILPLLTAENVASTLQIDRDTREDLIQLQQMQDIDDDLQSQLDLELLRRELPQGEEQIRREQAKRERHQGTAASLQQRYQSLHQQVISARRLRLEAAQRAQHGNGQDGERLPKPPPQGLKVPTSRLPQPLTLQQVREYNEKKTECKEHEKEDTKRHHRHHSITETKTVYYKDRQRNKKYQKNEWYKYKKYKFNNQEKRKKYSKSTALLQALRQEHQDDQDSQNQLSHQKTQKTISGTTSWST
eukprot:1930403-Amphidinium_carterae.1